MTDEWPGEWHSKTPVGDDLPAGESTGPSFVNDNEIRWLIGDGAESYLTMHGSIPDNRC